MSFSLSKEDFELLCIKLAIFVGIGLIPVSYYSGTESGFEFFVGANAG